MLGLLPSGSVVNAVDFSDGDAFIMFTYKKIEFHLFLSPGSHTLSCFEDDGGRNPSVARELFAFMDLDGSWTSNYEVTPSIPSYLNDAGTRWTFSRFYN